MSKLRQIEITYHTGYPEFDRTFIKEYPHEVNSWQITLDTDIAAIDHAFEYGITPYIEGDEFNNSKCPYYIGDCISGSWRELIP